MSSKDKGGGKNADRRSIQTVRPSALLGTATRRVQGITSDIDHLRLKSTNRDLKRSVAEVGAALVGEGIVLERGIEQASTVTASVLDPNDDLLNAKLLESAYRVELDGLDFTFVGVRGQASNVLDLVHEATPVWRLRQEKGAVKVYRGKWTRAEFLAQLVAEVKHPSIPMWVPELHAEQPIDTPAQARQAKAEAAPKRGPGLDHGANLTAKGVAATPAQIDAADTAMRAAVSHGADSEILTGLMMALINEADISDPPGGLADSAGWLQLQASDHPGVDPHNLPLVVKIFVTEGFTGAGSALELSKRYGLAEWVGKVMWTYNATTYPGATYEAEAREWVEAFGGGNLGKGTTDEQTVEATRRYAFQRGKKEDTWACGKRLADEVRYRWFEAAGVIYYISEPALLDSQVRMRVWRGADGIQAITFDYDTGKVVTEVRVTANVAAWAAPPGTVAALHGKGPADGLYIVSNIRTTLGRPQADITLKKPVAPLPEPAPETTTKSVGGFNTGDTSPAASGDLKDLNIDTSAGAPHWGGSADIAKAVVLPIAKQHGLTVDGTKEDGHNAGSDHSLSSTLAWAGDFPTTDGEAFARDVAAAFGDASVVHTTEGITVTVDGNTFRVQVLWDLTQPAGTVGDVYHRGHVHIGIERQ